ncbi:hypothetical protein VFPPC_14787 [Pochonia chlamydosporia 170]|uniref:Tat pathway signal sequence n=1 Tax=Pochonia chlamydosporia 170 TaxID=1380566 RepID=A0A179F4M7_METCM|nr:hypothetical protein VFPPC_14787 [Pochonia chlamydosporia 170]OAQ60133.1 hypothetical protein VFPPC_14787 [Pochonia chlamydosporia 170]
MVRYEKDYLPVNSEDSLSSNSSDGEYPDILTRSSRRQSWSTYAFHGVLISIYTTIFIFSTFHSQLKPSIFGLVDSPANVIGDESHLEIFPIQGPPHGKYTGEPRAEVDKAWKDLLQYNNIRVSDDWVERWGRKHEAVKLPDGGYLGMLSVFHELHCIKRLYQSLTPEYYFPNATEKELGINREHNQHCLEVLRMGATCRGDVSIITHMWTDIDAQPIVNQTAPHQCVDFSRVMDYSRRESVDVYQENYIVHPKFGPSFPHGHSIKPFKEQEKME